MAKLRALLDDSDVIMSGHSLHIVFYI